MINSEENGRDLAALVVPVAGRLVSTGDGTEPYRLLDAEGGVVEPATVFLRELLAAGRSAATLRSYGMDLLRWWRFLHAVNVVWDRASRLEARDFSCWIQLTVKQRRLISEKAGGANVPVTEAPNPFTGKPALGHRYAPATVAHSETVLRGFYDFHRDAGTGPILNPFPLDPARRSRRAHAHHNPMDGWARERVGRYRPTVPHRVPRAIPDQRFNELFAALSSNRDRALVGVLDLDRGACVGAAGSTAVRHRPRPTADHRGAQGNPGPPNRSQPRRTRSCGCACMRRNCPARSHEAAPSGCGGRCTSHDGR